jgi:hypothetical protein
MAKDLVLLKYTGSNGAKLAALCRPKEGLAVMEKIVGGDPDAPLWLEQPTESVVVIATDGTVNVTSAEDLTLLSFWFATAANWLKTHGG